MSITLFNQCVRNEEGHLVIPQSVEERFRHEARGQWDNEGQPTNLEAAAQDALQWLILLDTHDLDKLSQRFGYGAQDALKRCIRKLKQFLCLGGKTVKIHIIDEGIVEGITYCTVDNKLPIAFPQASYHKLCDLMNAIGAQRCQDAITVKNQSVWILEVDSVRFNCLKQEQDSAQAALVQETHLTQKLEQIGAQIAREIAQLNQHIDKLAALTVWERICLIFKPNRLKMPPF